MQEVISRGMLQYYRKSILMSAPKKKKTAGVSSSCGLSSSFTALSFYFGSLLFPLAIVLLHFQNILLISSKKSSNSAITSYAVNDNTDVFPYKKKKTAIEIIFFCLRAMLLGNMPHLVLMTNELFALSLNYYDTSLRYTQPSFARLDYADQSH